MCYFSRKCLNIINVFNIVDLRNMHPIQKMSSHWSLFLGGLSLLFSFGIRVGGFVAVLTILGLLLLLFTVALLSRVWALLLLGLFLIGYLGGGGFLHCLFGFGLGGLGWSLLLFALAIWRVWVVIGFIDFSLYFLVSWWFGDWGALLRSYLRFLCQGWCGFFLCFFFCWCGSWWLSNSLWSWLGGSFWCCFRCCLSLYWCDCWCCSWLFDYLFGWFWNYWFFDTVLLVSGLSSLVEHFF